MALRAIFALVAAALAWLAWHPPKPPAPSFVEARLPEQTARPEAQRLWRVVTRRIVWRLAAEDLQKRLIEAGLSPSMLVRREKVQVHAFDDARRFVDYQAAIRAQNEWRKLGIDASVVRVDDDEAPYRVALGRFFLAAYAQQMEATLRRLQKPYRYERRAMRLVVYRFTFAPRLREEAEKLWQRINALGVAQPVLMREDRFLAAFGDALNDNKAASD